MPLYNNQLPTTLVQSRLRTFHSSNPWTKAKLAVSGSNADGTSNWWGKTSNVLFPVGLGIVGGYFGGAAGAAAGSKFGTLINKGFDALGNNIMAGTDTQIQYQKTTETQQKDDALLQAAGGLLGNIAGSFNSNLLSSGGDESAVDAAKSATTPKYKSQLSDYMKLFGSGQNNGSPEWANIANGLLGNANMNTTLNRANEQMFNMNTENQGLQTSIVQDTSTNSSDIKFLDERKKTTAPSSLPYNRFSGFRSGGESMPFKFFAAGGETEKAESGTPDIKTRIAMADGTFTEKDPYSQKDNGKFGKYNLTPTEIFKFAPGLSMDQFLESPQAQEGAIEKALIQYKSESQNIRKQTGTNWDDDSLMLLTHYKGSPEGIKMLKKPELLNKSSKNNPSVMDYIGKRSFGIYKNGSELIPFKFFDNIKK